MAGKKSSFMDGRYGSDELTKFQILLGIACIFLSNIIIGLYLNLVGLIIVAYAYIRVFSKDINKRAAQNDKYLYYKTRVQSFFNRK